MGAGAEVGKGEGHLGQLQLQGGGAAVVGGADQLGGGDRQQFADAFEHLLLDGMVDLQVALQGPVQLAAGGQEGRVLAGAVVLQGAAGALGDGALQVGGFHFGSPEQAEGLAGVGGRAAMGGAGNGQAPVAAAAALGGAAADKGHGLERFEGAAHETQLLGITGPQQHPAAAVTDHRMDPVLGFGDAIAQQPHLQGRHQGAAMGSRKAGGQGHGERCGGVGGRRNRIRKPGRARCRRSAAGPPP